MLMDPDLEQNRRRRGPLSPSRHWPLAVITGLFVLSACAGGATPTTHRAEILPTPTTAFPATPTNEQATTTSPVVTIDASFALTTVVFGDQGWIEVVNTGLQAANIHGQWIAIHPFYLELPSRIVEVGASVRISLDPDADPELVVCAASLLPALDPAAGEVGLYSSGNFGDPDAIVDYLEWGSGGHFRSTVAIAAGIWDETDVVPMKGNEGGLHITENGETAAEPIDAAEVANPSDTG